MCPVSTVSSLSTKRCAFSRGGRARDSLLITIGGSNLSCGISRRRPIPLAFARMVTGLIIGLACGGR